MNKKKTFIKNLSEDKKKKLLAHFNGIYSTPQSKLTENEWSIIYLAWLWENGLVIKNKEGFYVFDETKAGVPLSDYEEIYFGEEIYIPGSYNLESIHMQYEFDQLIPIL